MARNRDRSRSPPRPAPYPYEISAKECATEGCDFRIWNRWSDVWAQYVWSGNFCCCKCRDTAGRDHDDNQCTSNYRPRGQAIGSGSSSSGHQEAWQDPRDQLDYAPPAAAAAAGGSSSWIIQQQPPSVLAAAAIRIQKLFRRFKPY